MDRETLKTIRLGGSPFSGWARKVHRVLFALFLAQWALVSARLWPEHPPFSEARWPEGVLLVLAAGSTLSWLTTRLPGQNVILAAILIATLGSTSQGLGAISGVPFGPYVFTRNFGQELFHPLPWTVPLLWIVVVLNSREVARLILRPWRGGPSRGYWVMSLTAALVVLLDLGLEPFAGVVKGYWFWNASRAGLYWYRAPWVNFLGWAVTTLLILAFATPCMINKKPGKPPPPEYHPVIIWLLVNLLFAMGAASRQLWPAVVLVAVDSVTVGLLAVRAARRPLESPMLPS